MQNIEITYDEETKYYDALVLSKWITTQARDLNELIKNLQEAFSLSREKKVFLNKFSISFDEKYVNI